LASDPSVPYSQEEKLEFVNPRTKALPTTRSRHYGEGRVTWKGLRRISNQGPNGPWDADPGTTTGGTKAYSGTQVTTSEGHPFRNNPNVGRADIGGNFYSQKRYVSHEGGRNLKVRFKPTSQQWAQQDYSGPVLAVDPSSNLYPSDQASAIAALHAYGTTAIANTKPTNPVAGLTTALVELHRDGLPHLFGSTLWEGRTSIIRSAGEEYLNKEFGWDPLVNDIKSFASGVVHASDVIERYKRGIGKPTRRRFDFTPIESSTTTNLGAALPYTGQPYAYLFGVGTNGTLSVETRVSKQRWFTGAFTYYFPAKLGGKMSDLSILAQRLGLELTPEVLWEAAPGSWAVDWFSNIGDVISNWTSFHEDGLVMLYGYMMEHTIVSNTYRLDGAILADGRPCPVSPVTFVIETKQRQGATPYGFGLNFGALSGFQKSIMGALGLTKLFR
jgi:hypothetical protein